MLPWRLCERIKEMSGCDGDFVSLIERMGTQPQMIWLRCGNRSSCELGRILEATLPDGITLIESWQPIVEVTGA